MFSQILLKIPIAQRYLKGRASLQKIIDNVFWLSFDKVLRLGVGLFVMGWVARYLGPEQFGLWNYAIAFTSLFGAFATLGLDGIVVREIVKNPEKTEELLGTAFILRLIGASIAFMLSIGGAFLLGNTDALTLSLIALSAGGFIFQAFLTIDYYFQAHIMSKYTVWAQNTAFFIMSIAKVVLILKEAPLIAFAITGLLEIVITTAFLVFFILKSSSINIKNLRLSLQTAKSLLKESWSLLLGGIAITIYMRIDQVMIKEMLGDREAGLYSAAVRISEAWYFIPMVISGSVFPRLVEYKKISDELYYKKLLVLFSYMSWLGIGIGIFFTIFAYTIVSFLFGNEYLNARNVLTIHAWSGVFVCLGVASSGWLLIENLTKISFYRTFLGALSNIALNFILIPVFSISGAAIATLISYTIAGYIADLFSHKTKKLFLLKTKSFTPYFLWRKYS